MTGPIQFGHHISLKHNMTGRYLTSEAGRFYEEGSGQQVVFAGGWEPSSETTFIVMPRLGEDEIEEGVDVNFGDVIRLKHAATRANLHSHPDIPSPITGQQEVTCFGDDETSDENDEWIVEQWSFDENENEEFDVEDPTWYADRSFFLRHVTTGLTLHSHEEPLHEDQNEVSAFGDGPDENDRWRASFD
ncbi:MIR motif-containing protein [Cokeromyces recurvatus]|uniref:MIR motif-containing protein n=1 Tax=Cokeromyces recurvatus TaxID=90255 RepID=UPI0022202C9F|nr:MIR motif-containing protein [Cokeromyces recurvatus]KAI7900687.1 MIR motif-containing protein [Cokeromyces recurvatus]